MDIAELKLRGSSDMDEWGQGLNLSASTGSLVKPTSEFLFFHL